MAAMAAPSGTKSQVLPRLLATIALVGIYLFGALATTTTVLSFGASKAEARGRRGRGIYFRGGGYCTIQRYRCADIYGWGSGAYYRCIWRRGC